MAKTKKDNKELTRDYFMMESMARELKWHQQRVRELGKRMTNKAKIRLKDGVIENLDLVVNHMHNAEKELNRAMDKIKMI